MPSGTFLINSLKNINANKSSVYSFEESKRDTIYCWINLFSIA